MNLRSTLALTLLGMALGGWTTDAEACAPPPCSPASSAPWLGDTIPANAPALGFRKASGNLGAPVSAQITLQGPDAGMVPLSIDADPDDPALLYLRPAQLEEGATYVLAFERSCDFAAPANDAGYVEVPFTTGGNAPLPQAAGTLGAQVQVEADLLVPTVRGSCTAPIEAAVARLQLEPTSALAAFAPLVRWRVAVDGAPWSTGPWGGLDDGGTLLPHPQRGIPPRHPGVIFARCAPRDQDGTDPGLPEGVHQVEVTAELAGAGDLPPLAVQVDLRCATTADGGLQPETDGGPQPDRDGGAPGGDEGTGGQGVAPGCGCDESGSFVGGVGLVLLLTSALTRSRRRRADPDT